MSKWNLKFNGNSADLPVAEFLFRVETLARSADIDPDSLPQGMHYILREKAEAWFWVHLRDNPEEGWQDFKTVMCNHFSILETQIEVREKIYRRKQRNGESFANFFIDVSSLASRLNNRMLDCDMVEILRANMCSRLKHSLLFQPTPTAANLLDCAKRCERLWEAESAMSNYERGRVPGARISEIHIDNTDSHNPQMTDRTEQHGMYSQEMHQVQDHIEVLNHVRRNTPIVPGRSDLVICWNCDDIGHYHDVCPVATKNLYCYGCGNKGVYKNECPKCSSGNVRPAAHPQGNVRPALCQRAPNPFQRN